MILTEYNEKQHMKTVRKEGYEEGAMSRQPEVDTLHSEIDTLNVALKEKDAELEKFKSLLLANGIEIDK